MTMRIKLLATTLRGPYLVRHGPDTDPGTLPAEWAQPIARARAAESVILCGMRRPLGSCQPATCGLRKG
jgi:hypothetical protein